MVAVVMLLWRAAVRGRRNRVEMRRLTPAGSRGSSCSGGRRGGNSTDEVRAGWPARVFGGVGIPNLFVNI